MIWSANTKV